MLKHCLRCDYRWQAQVERPQKCPRCFCRSWDSQRWVWEHRTTRFFLESGIHDMLWIGSP